MQARRSDASSAHEEKKTESTTQADELISIRQLRGRRAATAVEVELDDEADITKGASAVLVCRSRGPGAPRPPCPPSPTVCSRSLFPCPSRPTVNLRASLLPPPPIF